MQQSILVIDDVADNILLLQDELEDQGYKVLTAQDGQSGLDLARSTVPDLILLDIMMPGMDGFEVLRQLRQDDKTQDVPVLMVSALDDEESIVRGLDQGAQDYVVKPFNLDIVQARVRATLRTKVGLDALKVMNRHLDASNARLLETNAQLEEFSAFVSHDLKEPLRKINMFTELLRKDLGTALEGAAANDLEQIHSATDRMQQLIEDLLNLAQARSGEVKATEVMLENCLDQAVEVLSVMLDDRGVELERDAMPQVIGDPFLLTQVLVNLISNAAKYGPDQGGRIHITAETREEDWVIGVADNGPGIPEDLRAQILEPFQRLNEKAEIEGTGIGLAICQKAIERMEGDLWIEQAEPQGAWFRFSLPRY